jgi:hypothetical protein
MRMRSSVAVLLGVLCLAAPVHADPRSDIAAKARAAMASYDAMDYDAARKLLNQALAIAKRAKLDKDPIVARVYLDLGIAQLASSDQEAAKVAFLSAVQIDPKIAIDPAYKSAELVRMLDDAKAAAGDPGSDPGDECRALRGIQHTAIEGARRGVAQPIDVQIGGDVSPARVVVMYRPEGAIDFTEARLARQGGCRFTGTIPAAAMHGAVLHYYIAAYDANNKVLVAKGSSGAPNVLEFGGPGAPAREPEVAVGGDRPDAPPQRDTTPPAAATPASHPRVVVAASVGTGVGYVTGKTEGDNVVQNCCIGVSRVVLTPEIRYQLGPRLSIGAVGRFGLPLGANIMGHSSLAPAGLVRVGYAFSDSGSGMHVMGEVGFGILRNTIQLDAKTPGMDTDIVAQGPLLVGAGVGYTRRLGDSFALLFDLDVIGGIAVVSKLGTAIHLNNGVGADLRLGVAVGF